LWGYSLKFRPFIGLIYGRYLQFRYLKWPLNMFYSFFGVFLSKSKIRHEELGREDMGYRSGTHKKWGAVEILYPQNIDYVATTGS